MLSALSHLSQSQVITKPHVGCHGYLYTAGSSSLIRLVWGRRRLAKNPCCTYICWETSFSQYSFALIGFVTGMSCTQCFADAGIDTCMLLTASKSRCSLMSFLKDGKNEARKLNNERTAAGFCQWLYWDLGCFYSCSCTQAAIKGIAVVSVIWMHSLLQRLGQGGRRGGQRKRWDRGGNFGEPRRCWRLQLASISGSQCTSFPRCLPLIFLKGVMLETDLITIQKTWEMQSVAFTILLQKRPWRF